MGTDESETLLALIEKRGKIEPGRIAFTFYNQTPCTYGFLVKRIHESAAYLSHRGVQPNEPVLIAIPNSPEFFFAFYAIQLIEASPVPVFPGSGTHRIIKLAKLCDADSIIVSSGAGAMDFSRLKEEADNYGKQMFFIEDRLDDCSGNRFPVPGAGDTAFIQFTSGSVGDPKAVRLSHENIMTNIKQMMAGMEIDEQDRFVSWLPVYHDMGLILMTMVPFYLGTPFVLLPTGLNHLRGWLEAIERHKATFTAAPDFAYRLCLMYIREPGKFNLSSLRIALNAAEPVREKTIREFEKRFKLKNVLLPAYGLAEATVGVCCAKPGQEIITDSRGNVSVGFPFPGIEMKVLPGTLRQESESTRDIEAAGEIGVKSSAGCTGYVGNSRASKDLFDENGFIKTGDLGYADGEGNWFIIGRKKNIIIQGGVNIAAREVEELEEEFSFVRRSAALGISLKTYQGEQVFIFAEVSLTRSELQEENVLEDLSAQIVRRFLENFGFRPGRVLLLRSGSIPMTDSGKIRYLQLKEDYENGILKKRGRILFPDY